MSVVRLELRRLRARLSAPFANRLMPLRTWWRRRRVDEVLNWRQSRFRLRVVKIVSVGAALFLVGVAGLAVYLAYRAFRVKNQSAALDPFDDVCQRASFSCNVIVGTFLPVLLIAAASIVFLFFRLRRVRKPYVRKARREPHVMVETAGRITGEVVGRDQLSRVMMQDLRDRGTRRPHVVVGGVGTGKTALIVLLTEQLAKRGAVPVPVRLRNAQSELDFRELGRRRFLAGAETAHLSEADRERVWWELCRNDKVVVLADGLEEALIEGEVKGDRDNLIRLAIKRAHDQGLALVIASRPHDPLRVMDATIVELEPLSEEAAITYVQGDHRSADRRLDWIVETADVAEMPLYLQISRQIHAHRLMDYVSPAQTDAGQLDIRDLDRAALRLRLLDTWTQALVRGDLEAEVPLKRADRNATLEQLSALACIGLMNDRLVVRFDELEESSNGPGGTRAASGQPPRSVVRAALKRLSHANRNRSSHPAILEAVRGRMDPDQHVDLRLAAARGTQLGLVEATGDGVRFPHSIMEAYLGSRLIDTAMAERSFGRAALQNPGRELLIALVMASRMKLEAGSDRDSRARARRARRVREQLVDAAGKRHDAKALDLYAAAFEVDCADADPQHRSIARKLLETWPKVVELDQRTLDDAQLNLVSRFGATARKLARQDPPDRDLAYPQLYEIACSAVSYPVRLAAAQEIAAGGDDAFGPLESVLGPPPADQLDGPPADKQHEDRAWREGVLRAWLSPLFVGSVGMDARDRARKNLGDWVGFVERREHEHPLRLSFEAALAQGFKHAANRRRARPQDRAFLADQAKEILKETNFWFTRLTLLHALCLWELPDDRGEERAVWTPKPDHRAQVDTWLSLLDDRQEHPFVIEARRLVLRALDTREPERFIWIDESGVLARVGSTPAGGDRERPRNLWIPPSTGWTALDPPTQQLVADVLLLLNLAERDRRPVVRDEHLNRTARDHLPPCLERDRSRLQPRQIVTQPDPGSNCMAGCQFSLCPYPPRGQQSYRAELSESFCRRQRTLIGKPFPRRALRRTARWQDELPRDLKQFWEDMGRRSQPPPPPARKR